MIAGIVFVRSALATIALKIMFYGLASATIAAKCVRAIRAQSSSVIFSSTSKFTSAIS